MKSRSTVDRCGPLTIGLHWLMVLQLSAVYACINLTNLFPNGSDPQVALESWHFMLGLSVLALVLIRIAARLSSPTPALMPGTPAWQHRVAGLTHLALYALLLGMPVLGWLALAAAGKPVPFFGAELPPLIGKSAPLASSLKRVHETVGVIGYYLIGVHVAAALYHHYVVRDGTIMRMLPTHRLRRTGVK
jgi:cytochrome b561